MQHSLYPLSHQGSPRRKDWVACPFSRESCDPQESNQGLLHCRHILYQLIHQASITTNKARGGDGISVELIQILKDDDVKVLHSICQEIWKTQQWPQDWKRSVFIPISKKGNAKKCSNYHTMAIISHASKVMLKILQVKFQQYMNWGLSDVQAGFRKGRGTRYPIANICWIIENAREFQKNSTSALLTMPKLLTVWITTSCGKFYKRWEYQTTIPASWEICMQVKKQQLELDMEQQTGSK